MSAKKMTIEEVKKMAMKYYEKGGDTIIECWDDNDILKFLDESKSPKKDLLKMFKLNEDIWNDMKGMSGWDAKIEKKNNEEYLSKLENKEDSLDDETLNNYTPSCTNGDYSPTHPWDAPGMSIKDFI